MNNEINSNTQQSIHPEKRKFSVTESVFAWLCLVIGFLFYHTVCHINDPLWFAAVAIIAVVSTMIVFIKRNKKFGIHWFALGVVSITFAVATVFAGSGFMRLSALISAVFSYLFMIFTASGARIEKGLSDMLPLDIFHSTLIYPFISSPGHLFRAFSTNSKKGSGKRILKILAGLAISFIPTTFIVLALSYDDSFTELFWKVFRMFKDFNILSQIAALIVGLLISIYVFGLYVSSSNPEKKIFIKADDCRNFGKTIRFVPVLTTVFALLPIAVVYIIFFISQWQYYVSAFTGILPKGVESYAEYARSGFFQLCIVSVVNFLILFAVYVFLKRNTKGDDLVLKVISVIFSLMTLVLIGTALAKMCLYISEYGLTELRFLAFWFMSLLAVIFLLIILKQFIRPLKLVPCSAIAFTLMFGALIFSNYQGIIADYNVNRYLNGTLETVDVGKLDDLGIEAVPAMVRLADEWDVKPDSYEYDPFGYIDFHDEGYIQYRLWVNLYEYKRNIDNMDDYDRTTGFSLPEYRAQKAIDAWTAE